MTKSEVQDELRAGTRRCYDTFRPCHACGQVSWHGAHGNRLQRMVDARTG